MRIQHNIPAMSSYRNYTNNVSAMSKNLEKLSSGYKINRAGDDAAGLAISEKMRAQITGLEVAQKNAKDGISLVQTAEGALTEVHDMLNRMYSLAEQSANGTYDNEVDRLQLQKEVDSLRTEINRIADSANFNGINLLDGSLDDGSSVTTSSKVTAEWVDVSKKALQSSLGIPKDKTLAKGGVYGTDTILETDKSGNGKPSFSVALDNVAHGVSDSTNGDMFTVSINGTAVTAKIGLGKTTGTVLTAADIAVYFSGKEVKIDKTTYRVSADGTNLKFTATQTTTGTVNPSYAVTFGGLEGKVQTGTKAVYAVSGFKFPAKGDKDLNIGAEINVNVNGETVKFTLDKMGCNAAGTAGFAGSLALAKGTLSDGTELTLGALFKIDSNGSKGGITFTAIFSGDDDLDNDTVEKGEGEYIAKIEDFNLTGDGMNVKGGVTFSGIPDNGFVGGVSMTTEGTDDYYIGTFNYDMATGQIQGGASSNTINAATTKVLSTGTVTNAQVANTFLDMNKIAIEDGLKLKLGNTEYVFAVGPDSKFANAEGMTVVDLTKLDKATLESADKLKEEAGAALTLAAKDNDIFSVGYDSTKKHITLQQLTSAKEKTDMSTMDGLLDYIGMSTLKPGSSVGVETTTSGSQGKALMLQIGDTAESFNQLKVSIKNMHAKSMGIGDVDISSQDGASTAMKKIKDAINYVSDARGTLGATQNRLDHTINNLSVMQENIQDAESTIRDVDVAAEMMNYTKNNILVQSAQAMLAQANQLPQGVLQLLG